MPPLIIFSILMSFGIFDAINGQFLTQEEYCDIHENHTLCIFPGKVAKRCGQVFERGLSNEERVLVTRLHNEKRSFIARGLEKRGDPGPQPPASNMMQLIYDEELEVEAQTWTDQCVRNHECPDCRTLPRFKVGQNLFWFGHFIGSWEKSVQGWYDEVADFNSSFVYPFFVIPGVLVGHFTQMTWAQTTKIGCGKLFATNPPDEPALQGNEFYVCNYGLAGNLVRSEMYKAGEPCSDCPPGTECSDEFPGLCKGIPLEPLTVKPPLRNLLDIEIKFGEEFRSRPRSIVTQGEVQVMPPIFVSEPPPPQEKDECIYKCQKNRGCSVNFSSFRFISGSIMGSCFPPDFGGECSGTPKLCQECKAVCDNFDPGQQVTFKVDEEGTETGEPTVTSLAEENSTKKQENGSSGNTCTYSCQPQGGCSVRINSKSFVSGSVLGSCFSEFFGGKCSGTPQGCQDCLEICKQSDKEETIVLPAS